MKSRDVFKAYKVTLTGEQVDDLIELLVEKISKGDQWIGSVHYNINCIERNIVLLRKLEAIGDEP